MFITRLLVYLVCLLAEVSSWSLSFGGGRQIRYDDGVLRIQLATPQSGTSSPPRDTSSIGGKQQVPPNGALVDPLVLECLQVRDTGTIKGFGVFCVKEVIPPHTFLGFYEGERITRDLWNDDSNKLSFDLPKSDYLMSLDGGQTLLDGTKRAKDRSVFSPCHLNHSDDQPNCIRILSDELDRVAFFTVSRQIELGEELCFDYGADYWRGREQEMI